MNDDTEAVVIILDPPPAPPGPRAADTIQTCNDFIAGTPSLAALRRAQAAIQCRIAQLGKTVAADEE